MKPTQCPCFRGRAISENHSFDSVKGDVLTKTSVLEPGKTFEINVLEGGLLALQKRTNGEAHRRQLLPGLVLQGLFYDSEQGAVAAFRLFSFDRAALSVGV